MHLLMVLLAFFPKSESHPEPFHRFSVPDSSVKISRITPTSAHISNHICILARWHLFYHAMSRLFYSCEIFGKYNWYFCNTPAPVLKSAICSLSKACYEQTTTSVFLGASFSSWETDSAGPGDIRQPKHCRMEQNAKSGAGTGGRNIFCK